MMKKDPFKIDSHKLQYHPERIDAWRNKRQVYPIYIEISPVGACNHRCTFCAVDYIGYESRSLDTKNLQDRLNEMGQLGVKSIMYAGEGEPLLHKDLPKIIAQTKRAGIDVAITTNAVPLTSSWTDQSLEYISWLKASINAGTPETYAQVHQTKKEDFQRVLKNLEFAVAAREERNLSCVLGAQMVLLPENWNEAVSLARIAKTIGLDYLVVKPYSQHNSSITHTYENVDYQDADELSQQLDEFNDDKFSVVFRENTMEKLKDSEPYYDKCQATPYFWAYIMADGSVYGCSAYLLDEKFCYGNIQEQSFQEIWEGEKRLKSKQFVEHELEIKDCRKNCRMDEVNRYLWDIIHPPEHVNFI
jgi:GTP 3',8-cyclase